jgi:predicted nucleic acid-binding protein
VGWVDALKGHKVGLDTAPLIYYTEQNGAYLEKVDPFFAALAKGELQVVTSVMTLLEVLVRPIRNGNLTLVQIYREFLFNTNDLAIYEVSQEIAEEAARLRALYKIRTPDSIQLATAIHQKATFFLTNDIVLSSLPGIKILVLDDLKDDDPDKET